MIKRNAIGVDRKALDLLEGVDVISPESLHKLRVATKRLRSYWKFAEPETGSTKSSKAQRRLSDSAKMLGKDRDLTVMCDTLGRLDKHIRSGKARKSIQKAHGTISLESEGGNHKERVKLLTNAFVEDLKKWESLEPNPNKISFGRRIAETYGRAHGFIRDSSKNDDIRIFHKSRRWTNYLRYQLETLEIDRSPWLKAHFSELKQLGRELGRRQDLYVLRHFVEKSKRFEKGDKRRLIDLIETEDAITLVRCRGFSESLFVLTPLDYQNRVNEEFRQFGLLES